MYSLSCGAETALLGLCHSATTIVATTVVLPVATIILTSLSGCNVCFTVFFLMSWELGSVAFKNGSVHGLDTVHCCQLKINSMKAAFHI